MKQIFKTLLSGTAAIGVVLVAFRLGAELTSREAVRRDRARLDQATKAYAREIEAAGTAVDWPQVLSRIKDSVSGVSEAALFDPAGDLVARTDPTKSTENPHFSAQMELGSVLHMPLTNDGKPWGEIQLFVDPMSDRMGNISPWRLLKAEHIPPSAWVAGLGLLGLAIRGSRRRTGKPAPVSYLTKALDSLSEGIVILDNHGRVVSCNSSFGELVGLPIDELPGQRIDTLAWSRIGWEAGFPWDIALKQGKDIQRCVMELCDSRGKELTLSVNVARIHDEQSNVRGFLVSCENTTEIEQRNATVLQLLNRLEKSRYQLEAQGETLRRQAVLDPLTQCLNRAAVVTQSEKEFSAASESKPLSCIIMGIDQLHAVNAANGNEGGDSVLLEIARLLHDTCPESVKVARYGGDEFLLLLPQTNIDNAMKLAEQIRREIAELKLGPIAVTASFGVSATTMAVGSHQQLVALAEHALRTAKVWGRNQVRRGDQMPDTVPAPTVRKLISDAWDQDGNCEPSTQTTEALLIALRIHEPRVAAHSRRVADLATTLARGLLAPADLAVLRTVALLHEIGRLGNKNPLGAMRGGRESVGGAIDGRGGPRVDPLAALNAELGDRVGEEILLAAFGSPRVMAVYAGFRAPRYIVRDHLIPLGARILQVAHAYDDLAYGGGELSEPRDPARVLAELRSLSGNRLEPAVVERLAKYLLTSDIRALESKAVTLEMPHPDDANQGDFQTFQTNCGFPSR